MKRKIKNVVLYGTTVALLSLSGCTNGTTNVNTTEESTVVNTENTELETVKVNNDRKGVNESEIAPTIEKTTEETSEIETTEEESITETETEIETTIDKSAQVDDKLDELFNKNKAFYTTHLVHEKQLREIYYTLNGMYYDENGKQLIGNEYIVNAYRNIESILSPYEMINEITFIRMNEMGIEVFSYEPFELPEVPSLVPLIESNTPGSEMLIERVAKYEKARNTVIEGLRSGKLDTDEIVNFASEIKDTDVTADLTDGENYLFNAINYYGLDLVLKTGSADAVNNRKGGNNDINAEYTKYRENMDNCYSIYSGGIEENKSLTKAYKLR